MHVSARILPLEEASRLAPTVALQELRNAGPRGPVRAASTSGSEPGVAVIREGADIIGVAPLRWRELRLGLRRRCRIAVVAPVILPSRDVSAERKELAYRAMLDLLSRADQPAHIVSFELDAEDTRDVDQLWRLGIALCARCDVRERDGRLLVDIIFPGIRGEVGAFLREVRDGGLRDRLTSRLRAMRHDRARPPLDGGAVLFALDLSRSPALVSPPPDVELFEVDSNELARRPGLYGLSLVAARTSPDAARCYAARVGTEVVFRMYACDVRVNNPGGPYADALARLPHPSAMIFSAQTVPEQRGRSIYPAALVWAADLHRRSGYRSLCLTAQLENPSAVRAAVKAGFERVD